MFVKLAILLIVGLSMVVAVPEPVPEANPEPLVVSTYHGVPLLRSLGATVHGVHGLHGVHDVHDVQGVHGVHDVHGIHEVHGVHGVPVSTYSAPSVLTAGIAGPSLVNPYAATVIV